MNHLEQLKQQLMVKPNVQERERVAVIIKGDQGVKKRPSDKTIAEEVEEGVIDLGEQISEIQNLEGLLPVSISVPADADQRPIIIDKTHEGFDCQALLARLAENKRAKVTTVRAQKPEVEPEVEPAKERRVKKPKKTQLQQPLMIIEDAELEEGQEITLKPKTSKMVIEGESIPIVAPKERKRKTEKPEKGIAVLGPEVVVEMGDTDLTKRLPKRMPPVNIKVGNYVMNNREMFVNFINSLFEPYKREMEENKEGISCDNIGKTSSDFSLLTHQKIVRDYMNLYTPYRGLLLFHGLGSGKTCTSIAIAEGMKDSKSIIVMTPASLRANYIGELKKCGDLLYKKNQFWEWISIDTFPDSLKTMSAILNLPQEYIQRNGGAFFVNIKKKPNYDEMSDANKSILEEQLNAMIRQKYQFINYNGLREKRLEEMSSGYTKNIFDDSVVIIDEAHNFISRIVNKIKKSKKIEENQRGEKAHLPTNLSLKLYEMLLSAKNARMILLSGTPVINYPNEFGILFNILRGYIKTWRIPLTINTNKKIDRDSIRDMLLVEKTLDYIDYSPSSKILTITRNPFGFKNKIKKDMTYQGVTNVKKTDKGDEFETDFISDDDFERRVISILKRNEIDVVPNGIEIKYKKALPDTFDEFVARYVNETDRTLKNADGLKRRILGLSSYFRSAQENLLPRYNKQLGVDYHIVRVPMSDTQFKLYEAARVEERKMESSSKKPGVGMGDDYEQKTATYRIFSRLACNFAIPDRPVPTVKAKKADEEGEEKEEEADHVASDMERALKEGRLFDTRQDIADQREGEVEGDEILQELGGTTYIERLQHKLQDMAQHSDDFFTPEALQIYSPKFLHILENIQDPEYAGLHLVYSQFRTAEGIGLFTLALNKNGFTQFKIKKNNLGLWEIAIPEADQGKLTYALYTGTETVEEKEIVRKIYNGEWDDIPDSISSVLKAKYRNNNMGEVVKVFMITSSGSEGINLRNTRYVHLMDPYWHPVRSEQVIGRARRICSHKDLPPALQTVTVFVYLMVFTPQQIESGKELRRKDVSKLDKSVVQTSDQYLFEISEIKAKLTNQLTEAVKESSFDCYLYGNGKCVNFGDPTMDKFSYVPDYAEQQNEATVRANKVAVEMHGKPVTINGVQYVYVHVNKNLSKIYDFNSYKAALKDPNVMPVQIGTIEPNEKGEKVFKQLVT